MRRKQLMTRRQDRDRGAGEFRWNLPAARLNTEKGAGQHHRAFHARTPEHRTGHQRRRTVEPRLACGHRAQRPDCRRMVEEQGSHAAKPRNLGLPLQGSLYRPARSLRRGQNHICGENHHCHRIHTGASSIPGADLAITSDDLMHLKELPKRLVVIGGGFIGLELGSHSPGQAAMSRSCNRHRKSARPWIMRFGISFWNRPVQLVWQS